MEEIIIKIKLKEIFDNNIPKINDLVKGLVFDIQKLDIEVLDYTQIQTKMITPNKNG